MIRSVKILALAATVLMTAPAAMATWMSHGTFEPDVVEDAQQGWMFADPPEGDAKQVYFNVFETVGSGLTPNPSPNSNVGAAQTRMTDPNRSYKAILGVWKDCNEDGYVGLAESAVHTYRVELGEHDDTVCPVQGGLQSHNDGEWIRELIPIGHDKANTTSSLWNETDDNFYEDIGAMVWGDAGYPGENLAATGTGNTCYIRPQPRGTFVTTGSFMTNVVECRLDHGDEYNGIVRTVDSGDATGLALENEENWNEAGHPLNQPFMGRESEDDRAVTVWDCRPEERLVDEDVVVPFDDPTGELDDDVPDDEQWTVEDELIVPGVAPALGPGTGAYATVNHTLEGTPGNDDCDSTNDGGDVYFLVEGDVANQNAAETGKLAAAFNFRYWSQPFSALAKDPDASDFLGVGDDGPEAENVYTGPHDLGLMPLTSAMGTYWTSFATSVGANPVPVRHGLNPPADVDPNPSVGPLATYFTAYAYVPSWSTLGLSLPGQGVTGDYGHEWCDGATDGIHFGYNCDAELWNTNPDGSKAVPLQGVTKLAEPGDDYNLRDIDCMDSTALGLMSPCAAPLPTPAKDA